VTGTFQLLESWRRTTPADANTGKRSEKSQTRDPAQGGIKPANEDTYPFGDSPKPHGDPLRHVIEEQDKK
jgi:hypothetical protein